MRVENDGRLSWILFAILDSKSLHHRILSGGIGHRKPVALCVKPQFALNEAIVQRDKPVLNVESWRRALPGPNKIPSRKSAAFIRRGECPDFRARFIS